MVTSETKQPEDGVASDFEADLLAERVLRQGQAEWFAGQFPDLSKSLRQLATAYKRLRANGASIQAKPDNAASRP